MPSTLTIREECAKLADRRDFQKAFREVWELPYVVLPTPEGRHMTTKHSPLGVLKAQADRIAEMIKRAERGEKIDARFAEKIAAARDKPSFKVAIVMDDKIITVDMPWATIRATSEAGLSEYIVNQMRETRVSVQ